MSDQNNQKPVNTVEEQKRDKNKKILLFGILALVIILIVYVLCEDKNKGDTQQVRLATPARNMLPSVGSTSSSSTNNTSTRSSTSQTASSPSSASLSVGSSNASAVRRDLANLFRSYM